MSSVTPEWLGPQFVDVRVASTAPAVARARTVGRATAAREVGAASPTAVPTAVAGDPAAAAAATTTTTTGGDQQTGAITLPHDGGGTATTTATAETVIAIVAMTSGGSHAPAFGAAPRP
jgi:hypothetical protein